MRIKKLLFFILLFILFLFSCNTNVFGYEYNYENYIEYKYIASGNVHAFCCNEPFYIAPGEKHSDGLYYMSAYSLETNELVNIRYYRNGVDRYNKDVSASFLSSTEYPLEYGLITNYKGTFILYTDINKENIYFSNFSEDYSIFPYFLNSAEDIAKGNDDLIIMSGDFPNDKDISFVIQEIEETDDGSGGVIETSKNIFDVITLNYKSMYYCGVDDTGVGFYYKIPWSFLSQHLELTKKYNFVLAYDLNGERINDSLYITYGGLTEGDKIKNSIDIQSDLIRQQLIYQSIESERQKEQLETEKGIWETLKSVLNLLNPFSEDFFAYKLVEILLEGLKSLFIPSEEFLTNYFDELLNWFSDRLGFLSYPLELILDLLNRILNINFEEPIIQIPDFVEPSTNEKIISSTTYNLNSLLENNTFKTCHDIYFVLVDALIVFGLVNLLKNKLEEVFTK